MLIPGALTLGEEREERRRVWREIGLTKMERDGRSVLLGKKRVKAWRVPGTSEFVEHARLVACVAEVFSRQIHALDGQWADGDVRVRIP
jgi:hypothetical protein